MLGLAGTACFRDPPAGGHAVWNEIPVKRVFGVAAVLPSGVCAGIIESSNGRASVTPAPRMNVRRDMCFLVMNSCWISLGPVSKAAH